MRISDWSSDVCSSDLTVTGAVGQGDDVPTAPVTVAVALADKLDTIASFFAINEKPTGSKDPFALRRAALGVLALLQRNQIRTAITNGLDRAWLSASAYDLSRVEVDWARSVLAEGGDAFEYFEKFSKRAMASEAAVERDAWLDARHSEYRGFQSNILDFLADRLKVQQDRKSTRMTSSH